METTCFLCGEPISRCNGFTLVRDWLAVMNGAKLKRIRVFCGRCSLSGAAEKWLKENPVHMESYP